MHRFRPSAVVDRFVKHLAQPYHSLTDDTGLLGGSSADLHCPWSWSQAPALKPLADFDVKRGLEVLG